MTEKTLPLLLSEKMFLTASHYNLGEDSFTGIIESNLHRPLRVSVLNQSYFNLISKRVNLNVLFQKKKGQFFKVRQPVPFLGVQILKTSEELLIWGKKQFDLELGPFHEMAVFKTLFNSFLYFKFHHVIMDGFSLFYFFHDLCSEYNKIISKDSSINNLQSDLAIYKQTMNQCLVEETQNYQQKKTFWMDYMKGNTGFSPLKESFNEVKIENNKIAVSESAVCSFFFRGKYIKKLYKIKTETKTSVFSLFAAVYGKALASVFDMPCVSLRVASSFRRNLKSKEEQKLLANLSCSFPLIIKASENSLKTAFHIRTQVREMLKHLPLNPLPWKQDDLKSFSKKKGRVVYLSFSYFFYQEKDFFGVIKKFQWCTAFLDLALFVILSEKRTLFAFSYKKNVFQKSDIKALMKAIKKEILLL